MFKFRIQVFVLILVGILLILPRAEAQYPESGSTEQSQETDHGDHGEYSESALRRFEIITLSSLPFTAVHSYLGVRGIQMIRTNKIAPQLTPINYRIMGISAVSLSLFIGVWDWVHTRNVDRSAPSIPGRKPPTPPDEQQVPDDGSIARAPNFSPHAGRSTYGFTTLETVSTKLNKWECESNVVIVLPLFEIRF